MLSYVMGKPGADDKRFNQLVSLGFPEDLVQLCLEGADRNTTVAQMVMQLSGAMVCRGSVRITNSQTLHPHLLTPCACLRGCTMAE